MKRTRLVLALLLLVGLLARLAGGVMVARQAEGTRNGDAPAFLFPDSHSFWAYARNLSERGRHIDDQNRHAWRTPLYSILLAGLHKAGVREAAHLRLLNNAIGLVNILLAFLLARTFFDERAGLVAGAMVAVYPFFVYFDNLILADTLGVTAGLGMTLAFARLITRIDEAAEAAAWKRPAVLAGLMLALAIMVKASFALIGAFFVAFLFVRLWRRPGRAGNTTCPLQRTAGAVLILSCALLLGMTPWWVRNYTAFKTFVPFSTMGGYTLYESNSENADGGPNNGKIVFPHPYPVVMAVLAQGTMVPVNETYSTMMGHDPKGIVWWIQEETLDWQGAKLWLPYGYSWPFAISSHASGRALVLVRRRCCTPDDFRGRQSNEAGGEHQCREDLIRDTLTGTRPDAERVADRILKDASLKWIRSNPGRFLALMPVKALRTWNIWPNWSGASAWKYKAISLLSYLPVMLLAFFALWMYRHQWRTVYVLLIPALYLTALHSVFMGSIRYRLPAMGPLIVLASAGICAILSRHRDRSNEAAPFPSANDTQPQ